MIKLPDAKGEIPEQLKTDNWAFHILARSDDPAIKCLNVKNLVSNLKSTMMYADLMEESIVIDNRQWIMKQFLDYQTLGANKAWNAYTQGKFGQAVEIAGAVLDSVLFLVYDSRFTKSQMNSFIPRSKST